MSRAEGAIGVLQLKAALGVEPQLHTTSEVALLATDAGVVVEVIDRSHYVELLIDRDGR